MDFTGTYQCPECGLHYKTKSLARDCENFCKLHHACSMEIAKQAVENKTEGTEP